MLERTQMQSSGFRNTGSPDAPTGFQLRLRLPNYRGTRLSLIDGVDVTVDGESFSHEANRIEVEGRTYGISELREETAARWPIGVAATVFVDKPGGLAPGIHTVVTTVRLRQPYFPIEFQPTLATEERKATIVA